MDALLQHYMNSPIYTNDKTNERLFLVRPLPRSTIVCTLRRELTAICMNKGWLRWVMNQRGEVGWAMNWEEVGR
uniref:Uncharacterized protein n=1 Tax=Ascaris lumbricoides TaxID=6252 RepID=A0A0M3IKW8_ASCLU